jgi:hypothetical protein
VSFKFDISAGEFFEIIRPAVLVISGVVSTWVLASARRHRFLNSTALVWAVGTLFFPLVTLPLYLIARSIRRRSKPLHGERDPGNRIPASALRQRVVIPLAYAGIVFSLIGYYLYREHHSFDAHLARAAQAKLNGKRGRAIDEYRAALKLEADAHTRKLLALELADSGDRVGALFELRMAEQGGEIDDRIFFYAGNLLDSLNLPNQATLEYRRFLESRACTQPWPDERCALATARVQARQPEFH